MKLSIIIPVFNSYELLKDLACQIVHQLTDETELIIVDDGSTDGLKNDKSRFIKHLKRNYGVSRARNEGVKRAKGEYVTFVDADDWVSGDFIETILGVIKTDKSRHDIYWFKAKTEDGQSNFHIAPVWAKAYNRKNIFSKIKFDENLKAGEDIAFLGDLNGHSYVCGEKTSCMRIPGRAIYCYRWSANRNSLSKRYNRGELS